MNVKVYKRYYGMVLGISIHLDFYRLCEQTIKLKVGELYSRCIIVSSNTLLKDLFGKANAIKSCKDKIRKQLPAFQLQSVHL